MADTAIPTPALELDSDHSSTNSNGKRKASHQLSRVDDDTPMDAAPTTTDDASVPLSKNHLKRIRRQQAYEDFKEERKVKRKEKRHAKQQRKRSERHAAVAAAEAAGLDPTTVLQPKKEPRPPRPVPVAIIIDCDFESYMRDPEIVSLSSQVVRSYSENKKARYQAHLFVSSFKGKLGSRFETVLKSTHRSWKGVRLMEGDFIEAAADAKMLLGEPKAGSPIDVLLSSEGKPGIVLEGAEEVAPEDLEAEDVDQSVVYLSSESPYTLERLEPGTSYVIGGLVDRNREKGLCYKRARDRKVRTAKLPIGEYMAMQSRYVLTTNQVIEIMVKWMECGDWGEAFLAVIPKRKGGTLKTQDGSQADPEETKDGQKEDGKGDSDDSDSDSE
ncbi:guanine-1-methyltransferase-domain-containing protein [Schizothecium vesticola]|uniref:tRNA (guanine(9)-N1)-methyltransferase n=1 Tax=Schizothecium vesticola TaxID=314040 RepID=A0AA40F2Q1_9PEZI|nr:guanine-1-methyltransferase-domain-containing protein [Schizothecium vesticola]